MTISNNGVLVGVIPYGKISTIAYKLGELSKGELLSRIPRIPLPEDGLNLKSLISLVRISYLVLLMELEKMYQKQSSSLQQYHLRNRTI